MTNELKPQIDRLRDKIEVLHAVPALEHRLRRAVSWLARGDAERDADAKYVFLWIAFNAAYAVERNSELGGDVNEAQRRESYFRALASLEDATRRVYRVLATELRSPIRDIMRNEYVYRGFWACVDDQPFNWRDWPNREGFKRDQEFVARLLGYGASSRSMETQLRALTLVPVDDVVAVLVVLFDRLNVLRNQLMHGCATQDGFLNRRQVDAGAMVLGPLMCEFLDAMADNPDRDWGPLAYPVRDDIREDRH